MSHMKLIKTAAEHETALVRLAALMELNPEIDSAKADELDVLSLLIEKYEEEHYPMDPPDPVEAIRFRMDQMGLKNKDLIPYIGSASKVSEILSGKRTLSLNMIRALHEKLGIPADILIQSSQHKKAFDSDIDWQAFPLAEMRKRGYFEDFNGSLQSLREYAPEHLSRFLASVKDGFNLQPAMLRTTAHLRTNDKETDPYSLWAWQVRVLQKADSEKLPATYKEGVVNRQWMQKLAQVSWSEQGPLLAKEYLNQAGIHLIFERHLPKTCLDGAVCHCSEENPVVALTMRNDRLDNFWFTLMHELAHIVLHLKKSEGWFIDDLDSESVDDLEAEADALANEALIPEKTWKKREVATADQVREVAAALYIAPSIVAGRVRHEKESHELFGKLFREKVSTILNRFN